MICPYCNQEHPDEAKFCPTTGRKIETDLFCTHCGAKLQPDWPFCAECRTPTGSVPRQVPISPVSPYRAFSRRSSKLTSWLIWSFGAILAAALILLVVDPFQLRLIGRLLGGYDPTASVMSAETDLYVGINLLNARTADLDRLGPLGAPFADLFGDEIRSSLPGANSLTDGSSGDTIAQIDQALQNEFGVTLSKDVTPWIGQYVGIGLVGLAESGSRSEPSLILAFEARDLGEADRYLEKLASVASDKQNTQFDRAEYNGVSIYVQQTVGLEDQLVFGRSGRMVLFATGLESMQQAIDAQESNSLANDPVFRELLRNLPRQNFAKVYLSAGEIKEVISSSISGSGDLLASIGLPIFAPSMSMPAWNGTMIGITLMDAGLQIDTLNSFDLQELSESERKILEGGGGDNRIVSKVSSDAIAYISGERLNEKWESLITTFADQRRINASTFATELEQDLGFDPRGDLFAYLDGEWVLAIVPMGISEFPQEENRKLGYFFLAEVEESEQVRNTFRLFADGNSAGIFTSLVPQYLEDGIIYEAYAHRDNDPAFAYGINQGYFVLGSSGNLIEENFSAGQLLSKTDKFQQVTGSLPSGGVPMFFVDVQELLGVLRLQMPDKELSSDERVRYLESIDWVAATQVPLRDGIAQSTVLIDVREK